MENSGTGVRHDNVLNVPNMLQDETFQDPTAILNKSIKIDPGSKVFSFSFPPCVFLKIITHEKSSYLPPVTFYCNMKLSIRI